MGDETEELDGIACFPARKVESRSLWDGEKPD